MTTRASPDEVGVQPSGWFAVQLRYAYLAGQPELATMVVRLCGCATSVGSTGPVLAVAIR